MRPAGGGGENLNLASRVGAPTPPAGAGAPRGLGCSVAPRMAAAADQAPAPRP